MGHFAPMKGEHGEMEEGGECFAPQRHLHECTRPWDQSRRYRLADTSRSALQLLCALVHEPQGHLCGSARTIELITKNAPRKVRSPTLEIYIKL